MQTRTINPQAIYQLRLKRGHSQDGVAHALRRHGFNTTARSVANWERGVNTPRANVIPALASILDVTIDELYADADDEESDPPMDAMDLELLRALKKWRTANQGAVA